jgi:hypothetical protein
VIREERERRRGRTRDGGNRHRLCTIVDGVTMDITRVVDDGGGISAM